MIKFIIKINLLLHLSQHLREFQIIFMEKLILIDNFISFEIKIIKIKIYLIHNK